MKLRFLLLVPASILPLLSAGCSSDEENVDSHGGQAGSAGTGAEVAKTTFFVTSDTSPTANLGGLEGADARCQRLADAAGLGAHTFHAYLSAEQDPEDESKTVDARDRIGTGPWYNSKGVLLAANSSALHALSGDPELFLDEKGNRVNGQWQDSPTPNEHDILTGTAADGTLLEGKTCADWTSEADDLTAQVGHTDGLGPSMNANPPYNSWNSVHESESCADTLPRGGAGKLYCFAID